MQSLSYLNGVASTSVSFTDNRGTNVIFDRAKTKDYSFTETSSTFDLLVGANIVEIINPSSANVRYKINLGSTTPTLTFGILPSGVTVNKVGTIYTVYGIDSVSDWEAIKQPTVNLNGFEGNFSYSAAVVYNTDTAADIEFEWNVGIYAPAAQLNTSFTMNITSNYVFGGTSNIQSYFILESFEFERVLGAAFYIQASPVKTTDTESSINIAASLIADPRSLNFDDSYVYYNNPYPADNTRFGDTLAIDGTGNYIIASIDNNEDYAAFALNSSAGSTQVEFSFARQGTIATGAPSDGKILAFNDNYVLIKEAIAAPDDTPSDDLIVLWKKQTSGDLYTVIDTVEFDDPSGGTGGAGNTIGTFNNTTCLTNNYLIVSDSAYDSDASFNPNGKVFVYSIDDTTGLTLEYSHTGVTDSSPGLPFRQYLGVDGLAISDTYYAYTESYKTSATGSWHEIFVRDTATGTLQHTFNGSNSTLEAKNLAIFGSDLYVTYWNDSSSLGTLVSYDLTDGSTNWTITLSGAGETELESIRQYNNDYIMVGGKIYSLTNGNFESNPGDGIFKSASVLIEGNGEYDNTYTNQGRVIVRTETSA